MPHLFAKRSSFSRPRLLGSAAIVALAATIAMASGSPSASAAAPASVPVAAVNAALPAQRHVRVADEIVRRLRRLGINFSKTWVDHPYDDDGVMC